MYETPIAYEQVRQRYPDALVEIEQQIKASKAKFQGKLISDTPISLFRFEFTCGVLIDGSYNGKEFFEKVYSGELQKEQEEKKIRDATETREQKFERRLKKLTDMSVRAKLTGSSRAFGAKINEIPHEVRTLVMDNVDRDIAERERQAKLTPEEHEQEKQALLKELSKSGGFFGIRIGMPNTGMQGSGGVGDVSSEVYIESGSKPAESVKPKRLDLNDLLE